MAARSLRTVALLLALVSIAALSAFIRGSWNGEQGKQARLFATPSGIIVTDEAAKARWARGQLDAAVRQFEKTFGRSPPRGVIVETSFVAVASSIPKSRRGWTLAWATPLFGSNGSTTTTGNLHHLDNESGMRHELTHLFFTARVVPNTRGFQYGGDAPDWLDEAAAIAAETGPAKTARLVSLRSQVCAGRLVPLDRFTRRPHPLFVSASMKKLLAKQRAENPGRAAMMTIRPDQIDVPEREIADFYAETTGLLTYLVERSGDPHVLRRVSNAIRENQDPRTWQDDPVLLSRMRLRRGEMDGDFERWALARARCGERGPTGLS